MRPAYSSPVDSTAAGFWETPKVIFFQHCELLRAYYANPASRPEREPTRVRRRLNLRVTESVAADRDRFSEQSLRSHPPRPFSQLLRHYSAAKDSVAKALLNYRIVEI